MRNLLIALVLILWPSLVFAGWLVSGGGSAGGGGDMLAENNLCDVDDAAAALVCISAQAQSDILDDLSTLGAPVSANQCVYSDGAGSFAYASCTATGLSVLAATDAAAARTAIDAQQESEPLTGISVLGSTPANRFLYTVGLDTWLDGIITSDGVALLGGSGAANLAFNPAVATDWDGDADPGNTDDALDQLAERVDDNEIVISGLGALATGNDAADVDYTCGVNTNWSASICPGRTDTALDELGQRVKALEGAGGGFDVWDWTKEVSSPNVADWTDASSAGADVSLTTLADCGTGDCVKMVAGASTTDNYGATTPIGAGDFTWCIRFSRNTLNVTSQGTVVTGAVFAAFVDGTDLDNDVWYGLGSVAISDDFDASLVLQARGNSGGDQWDAAYTTVVLNPYRSFMVNACFVRSGTDLTTYFSPHSDGGWVKSATETVSAGAGLMAIRIDVGDANEYRALVYAYGSPGGLPWE